MLPELDQGAVIDFLSSAAAHDGTAVDRIDTHAAVVFLAGDRALKLKRAVRFDYLDFSTPALRRAMCEAEVRLNRRTAPSIYRGVLPIARAPGGTFEIDGSGPAVDWVIEMRRFPQAALLDAHAAEGRLDIAAMPELGRRIAAFHRAARVRFDHGGSGGLRWVVDGNESGFAEFGDSILDRLKCHRVIESSRDVVEKRRVCLDTRRHHGFVRQCHGDLHLRNIVWIDDGPVLFDAVEFNDEIACVDVLYDLAFLLMDLWHRALPGHANAVWNAYLTESRDLAGIGLMPLFLSCRAAVRAKVDVTALRVQPDAPHRNELASAAKEYLELAGRFLAPSAPHLIAVGGLSGSGKSTLAAGLAPAVGTAPGAVVLQSDQIRKELFAVPSLEHLDQRAYTSEVTDQVYAILRERAAKVLRAGYCVIADASHMRPADRQAIEQVAAGTHAEFNGLWLKANPQLLAHRVNRRINDVSDATAEVVRMQASQDTGEIEWAPLDAAMPAAVILEAVASMARANGSMMEVDGWRPGF